MHILGRIDFPLFILNMSDLLKSQLEIKIVNAYSNDSASSNIDVNISHKSAKSFPRKTTSISKIYQSCLKAYQTAPKHDAFISNLYIRTL